MRNVAGVRFELIEPLSSDLQWLLKDFRLMVNNAIRAGIQMRVTSRYAIRKAVYKDFSQGFDIYKQYISEACCVAGGVLKNYRKAVRSGKQIATPYVKRLMLHANTQIYRIDRKTGEIDIAVRAGNHAKIKLVLSDYHRRYLSDENWSLGTLTLLPYGVLIAFRREAPKPYDPASALALDTNERSLDGALASSEALHQVHADMSEIATIQLRHHDRRKHLQEKKAHDRRTSRKLCSREGRREHNRIDNRLHELANHVLDFAEKNKSAIILEDLTGLRPSNKGKSLNRRISTWPRRKLHQIIEYKSQWRGIPLIKVDPRNTSKTCPVCGKLKKSRKDSMFRCECGWQCDRHINAGLNLLRSAIDSKGSVVGGLRFSPDALRHDTVIDLCADGVRRESNEASWQEGACPT